MKKEATEKRKYESPELTAVEFKRERGFLLSEATLMSDPIRFEYDGNDPYVTHYDNDDSWASYSWN